MLHSKDAQLRNLHRKLFPEEYDFMYDDGFDARLRKRGINPMNQEYQKNVNLRRYELGVKPYMSKTGVKQHNLTLLISSFDYCKRALNEKKDHNK